MGTRVDWHGDAWKKAFRSEMRKRTAFAARRLEAGIRKDISQAGDLEYHPMGSKGKALKSTKRIYNFTHSAPGNPPYKQFGRLRGSIANELVEHGAGTCIGRVGTNYKVGRYLELGTRKMKARPFLRPGLRKYGPELRAILTKTFPVGGLGAIGSNQSRSGILGAGARRAGY